MASHFAERAHSVLVFSAEWASILRRNVATRDYNSIDRQMRASVLWLGIRAHGTAGHGAWLARGKAGLGTALIGLRRLHHLCRISPPEDRIRSIAGLASRSGRRPYFHNFRLS
eukprot:6180043-Pleurochrysis_carterae.AAC.7